MNAELRFLLLQVRRPNDPMRFHEVECFARELGCSVERIKVLDLITGVPSPRDLAQADVVLLGGSGDYSAVGESDWLHRALDAMRGLHDTKKPTFASCWGFQAMARAMGGRVIHDPSNAELGSYELTLTPAGQEDPVFGPLESTFVGQVGHEDHVVELPETATLLATSERHLHAYRLDDAPIYCTQFHPELDLDGLVSRLRAYPRYVEMATGKSLETFTAGLVADPRTPQILRRFVEHSL